MPPKKKNNKKANDDWEAELGETVDPVAVAVQEAKATENSSNVGDEEGAAGAGGLMAALKKNKSKKQKKGKVVDEDYLDSDNLVGTVGLNGGYSNHEPAAPQIDIATKAPEEATTDDIFAMEITKSKGGKGKDEADESEEEGGTLKSKKEKEKEKKEREKQRKKEQVC